MAGKVKDALPWEMMGAETIFESMQESVVFLDLEGRIRQVNKEFEKGLGWERHEVIYKTILELGITTKEEYHKIENEIVPRLMRDGSVRYFETIAIRKDGGMFPVLMSWSLIKDEEGVPTGIINVATDITERKRIEENLRESEERYKAIFDTAANLILLSDRDGRIMECNNRSRDVLGYEPDELIGTRKVELVHPDHMEKAKVNHLETLRKGFTYNRELRMIRKDGSLIEANVNSSGLREENGEYTRLISIMEDITERKRAEKEMRRQLMKFDLKEGNVYLVEERAPAMSLECMKDLLHAGYRCLAIERTPEREFRKILPGDYDFLWLAEKRAEGTSTPKFGEMEHLVEKLPPKVAIHLERLDYLTAKNGFKEMLTFVNHLVEYAYLNDHIVIISMDPGMMDAHDFSLIRKETEEVKLRHIAKIPPVLYDILKYVYGNNKEGGKPSYSDLGQQLSISRPTVRGRIMRLIDLGLVIERIKGRSKFVELTPKGINLFTT